MTRWGSFRQRGDRRPLRVHFCVSCQEERPFRGLRCIVCKTKQPRLSKMGNVPEGRYDSQGEKERHGELLWLERAGHITDLQHHSTPFKLEVNGKDCGIWEPDFTYLEDGQRIAEDWKGWQTKENRLKHKLFVSLYPDILLRVTGYGRDRPRPTRRKRAA